ncbi:hypothetical protein PIB30_091162, partial [Stylosanthes scabra]|nr:hypothetical protein [Stylosanthes scabra]
MDEHSEGEEQIDSTVNDGDDRVQNGYEEGAGDPRKSDRGFRRVCPIVAKPPPLTVFPWDRDKGSAATPDPTGKVEDVDDNDNSNAEVFVVHRRGDTESDDRNSRGGEKPDYLNLRWLEVDKLVVSLSNRGALLRNVRIYKEEEKNGHKRAKKLATLANLYFNDAWFADENRVCKIVGLVERPIVQHLNPREITCGICFETYPDTKIQT